MACTRKKYKDKNQAGYVAILISVKTGKQFYATPCSICNHYHIYKGK